MAQREQQQQVAQSLYQQHSKLMGEVQVMLGSLNHQKGWSEVPSGVCYPEMGFLYFANSFVAELNKVLQSEETMVVKARLEKNLVD